ncbi:hypothetical protein [Saprospira grandis]|uniref:Uncharacterized protein n=1 Tax=Saprospira grandis (strain Lewin) TaxID=984262 RepID=H6L778_SAPGL|nr:hypothetical protein [Saprospira grandis]AFC26669.1 hypothetical protein SGRA_3954 [Saprospira grandis str. Lewin]
MILTSTGFLQRLVLGIAMFFMLNSCIEKECSGTKVSLTLKDVLEMDNGYEMHILETRNYSHCKYREGKFSLMEDGASYLDTCKNRERVTRILFLHEFDEKKFYYNTKTRIIRPEYLLENQIGYVEVNNGLPAAIGKYSRK